VLRCADLPQGLGDVPDPPGGILGVDMPTGVCVPEVPAAGPLRRGRCRERVLRCRHRAHILRSLRRQQVFVDDPKKIAVR
jgi:hypothetical protein